MMLSTSGRTVRLLFGAAGGVCLFFALIPPLIYGIFHIGVAVLLGGGLVLAVGAVFWKKMHRWLRRLLIAGVVLALLLAVAISIPMARQAWFCPPPADRPMTVIVLGGKVNGDRPSLILARRLRTAAQHLKDNPTASCIVSGGQGADEDYPEALVMAAYLEELGIAGERVIQEDRSTNTLENLAYSFALLEEGVTEVAVATDGFHQLRAAMICSSLGMGCYSLPASTPWGLLPSYWVREWVGLPVYWLKLQDI